MLRKIMASAGKATTVLALAASSLHAQVGDKGISPPSPAVSKLPAWDVVSIRPNKGESGRSGFMSTPDGMHLENVTVKMIAANSYGVRQDLISGLPAWAEKDHFDIDAKVSGEEVADMKTLTREQHRQMLLSILTERFHWTGHIEVKELPVYELVISKGGPKLKQSEPNNDPDAPKDSDGHPIPRSSTMMRPGELEAQGAEASNIAGALAGEVQRNVVDKTGLTGRYDLTLKWTPEQQATSHSHESGDSNDGASLFTALQEQLGLKLQASKGPVDTLVADHIEIPAEN